MKETFELEQKGVLRSCFPTNLYTNIIKKSLLENSISTLMIKNLIDNYIPFFPLGKDHVTECIKLEFKKHSVLDKVNVEKILNQLDYEPDNLLLYSTSGCKRVHRLVREYLLYDL